MSSSRFFAVSIGLYTAVMVIVSFFARSPESEAQTKINCATVPQCESLAQIIEARIRTLQKKPNLSWSDLARDTSGNVIAFTQDGAKKYCESLKMRLPLVREFSDLARDGGAYNAIIDTSFPGISANDPRVLKEIKKMRNEGLDWIDRLARGEMLPGVQGIIRVVDFYSSNHGYVWQKEALYRLWSSSVTVSSAEKPMEVPYVWLFRAWDGEHDVSSVTKSSEYKEIGGESKEVPTGVRCVVETK